MVRCCVVSIIVDVSTVVVVNYVFLFTTGTPQITNFHHNFQLSEVLL